jgi:hypothetical protein
MSLKRINKLISFSKTLCPDFVNHIENTNNLCLYKLGGHTIPRNLQFPKARTLTIINCNRTGILDIFHPTVFPNLANVNYLSADPGDFKLYERYNDTLSWVFPNKPYEFYDFMVRTGRGKKDAELIKKYVANKKIIDGQNGFDISFEFDINVPGYGIVNGDWWRSQFYEYLVRAQNNDNNNVADDFIIANQVLDINQEIEEEKFQKERVREDLETFSLEDMVDDD